MQSRFSSLIVLLISLSSSGWATDPGSSTRALPAGFALGSKAWTFQLAIRPGVLKDNSVLCRVEDQAGRPILTLKTGESGHQSLLLFTFTTDARPEPLSVGIPISLVDSAQAHKLVLRYEGYRMDFFVDSVLTDQEWPMGNLTQQAAARILASPQVSKAKFEDRLFSDDEIEGEAGGHEAVAQRETAMFGPANGAVQYWRPRGYNTSAGDTMPFFHDGTFHLFFLHDRRHHGSKWGLGAHEWWHMSTTDLVHWKEEPPALRITNEWEGSICTGSVFFHNGEYYAFYATRMPDRSERLGVATSVDGVHFQKQLPTPFAEPGFPYRQGPNRDPFAFQDGNQFRMLVTAELAHPEIARRGGALEQLISPDLKTWTPSSHPLLVPGYPGSQPECSDLFFWRGWYYLLFGQDGATHYRMARTSQGPWLTPAIDILDGPEAHVMKTAPFTGGRRIGVSFIPEGGWGGNLVFRELVQNTDGTLGTTFPSEMIPAANGSEAHAPITVHAPEGFGAAELDHVAANVRMTAILTPSPGTAAFGITLHAEAGMKNGLQLVFRPAIGQMQWVSTEANSLARPLATIDGAGDLKGPVNIELIAKEDIFDVSANGIHTLVHRAPGLQGTHAYLFVQDGNAAVSNLTVYPLLVKSAVQEARR